MRDDGGHGEWTLAKIMNLTMTIAHGGITTTADSGDRRSRSGRRHGGVRRRHYRHRGSRRCDRYSHVFNPRGGGGGGGGFACGAHFFLPFFGSGGGAVLRRTLFTPPTLSSRARVFLGESQAPLPHVVIA